MVGGVGEVGGQQGLLPARSHLAGGLSERRRGSLETRRGINSTTQLHVTPLRVYKQVPPQHRTRPTYPPANPTVFIEHHLCCRSPPRRVGAGLHSAPWTPRTAQLVAAQRHFFFLLIYLISVFTILCEIPGLLLSRILIPVLFPFLPVHGSDILIFQQAVKEKSALFFVRGCDAVVISLSPSIGVVPAAVRAN